MNKLLLLDNICIGELLSREIAKWLKGEDNCFTFNPFVKDEEYKNSNYGRVITCPENHLS